MSTSSVVTLLMSLMFDLASTFCQTIRPQPFAPYAIESYAVLLGKVRPIHSVAFSMLVRGQGELRK